MCCVQYKTAYILTPKSLYLFLTFSIFVFFSLPLDVEAAIISRPQNNLGLVGYWDFYVYIDGIAVYDRSGQENNGTLGNGLGSANTGNAYFSGKMDDVRIYSQPLTFSEIQTLYNIGQ